MQYRKFGRLDWKCSALGFGTMRLPALGQDPMRSPINEPEAIKMIHYAIDNGVNYIDTAFSYGMGASERVVGMALQNGYREKVRLATKLTPYVLKSADEFERYLSAQLKRLQTNKIDFYLLHGMTAQNWQKMKEWKAIQFVEKKMAEGKIGCLGFSFHDQYPVFKEIVDAYDNWTFCQIQYNYLDENNQAGRQGVEYAAARGMGLVVMEPLRGGQLARVPPPAVAKEWVEAEKRRSRTEWALDWIWNQPEISVVLSGMSTMQQTMQNVEFASRSGAGMLSTADLNLFKKITQAYQSLSPIPCTGCQYCQPCPNGVNIPRVFEFYNDKTVNENIQATIWYNVPEFGMPAEQRANNCIECGECLDKCPQHINIPEELKKAHAALTQGPPMGPPPGGAVSFDA
jgi:uncharacterized protein